MSRQLQKGKRVRILMPMMPDIPTQGIIYYHNAGREAPWYVRPDGWPSRRAGIAFKTEEIEPVEEVQA